MNLLVITNLYPPQELGGYGRSIADFVWGLRGRGNEVKVISSDAPYLDHAKSIEEIDNSVERSLYLKGSFQNGVHHLRNQQEIRNIDTHNQRRIKHLLRHNEFHGVLVGNLDLLGPEILTPLLKLNIPILHHIGYTAKPFAEGLHPKSTNYRIVAASEAVKRSLIAQGIPANTAPIIYPGSRCDLFGAESTGRNLPAPLDSESQFITFGTQKYPLKICYAGLLMHSKGPHTIAEAMFYLKKKKITATASFAGGRFQKGYCEHITSFLDQHNLENEVQWYKQLTREQLARYFCLHNVAVFPSIHPEAFGIVAAEAMASGLLLVTSGIGGASELIENGISGMLYEPGNAYHLAEILHWLCQQPQSDLRLMAHRGQSRVRKYFSVRHSANQIEKVFKGSFYNTSDSKRDSNFGQTTF